MASIGRFPRHFVDDYDENDVIFGRGKGSYNNPGNKHLQLVIRQHFQQYDVADLQTKTLLAHKVADVMVTKKPPSRFLRADKDYNRWYEMSREEVVKKIKQDFANLKSAHKRKIEDDPVALSLQENKRRAKDVVSPSTLIELCNNDGSEAEVKTEMSAIMAVVNQVFVHHPRLEPKRQADLVLNDSAVKEAIVSILNWKAEEHGDMRKRLSSKKKIGTAIANLPKSSSTPLMPYAKRLPKTSTQSPAVKTDAAHMGKVCDKVHFDAKMEDVNKISRGLRVKNDRSYTGSVMHTNPHGVGFMNFDDGRIYCGGWRKGKLHGNACVLYKNGDKFLGEYAKNKRTGEGVCYYSDGAIYQGEFKNDRLNGKGSYNSRSGDVYEGEFVNGIFEGVGVHRKSDGTETKGRFSNWKKVFSSLDGEEMAAAASASAPTPVSTLGGEKPGPSKNAPVPTATPGGEKLKHMKNGFKTDSSSDLSDTKKNGGQATPKQEEKEVKDKDKDKDKDRNQEKAESDEKPTPDESPDKPDEADAEDEGTENGSKDVAIKMETEDTNDNNGQFDDDEEDDVII
ncbi:MAG: hypothetical protein SGBAC_005442 [Bacillariaceae sp.]